MNRQLLLVLVAWFVIGSCISARAAEPNVGNTKPVIVTAIEAADRNANNTGNSGSNTYTGGTTVTAGTLVLANNSALADNRFAGKIVRVNMTQGTRNEVFVLENVKVEPGSETFLVGTGIKSDPDRTSFYEGLEVHLKLRLITSYIVMTPEQWKDKQRSTPRFGPPRSSTDLRTIPPASVIAPDRPSAIGPDQSTVPPAFVPDRFTPAEPVSGRYEPSAAEPGTARFDAVPAESPNPSIPSAFERIPNPSTPSAPAIGQSSRTQPAVVPPVSPAQLAVPYPVFPTQQVGQDKHGWEYKVVTFKVGDGDDAQTKEIQLLAADGWEYVGPLCAGANPYQLSSRPGTVTSCGHVLFKRPKR